MKQIEYRIKEITDKLYRNLPDEVQHELINIALGIMDIPRGTMMVENMREMDVESNQEMKERFFKLIISTPLKDYISSLTFSEEQISFLKNKKNKRLVTSLKNQGYILGFYASRGEIQLFPSGDLITIGIDHLWERCKEYRHYGYKFAVWRNLIKIGNNTPSYYTSFLNAKNSAEFAAICQSQSLVPIVGFEIASEGSYTIEQAKKTLENILSMTYRAFGEERIFLKGLIIQTTLIKSGINSNREDTPQEIAEATFDAFSRTILTGTKGIQIVTGNLPKETVKENLNALFNLNNKRTPWLINFSVGRNLELVALSMWKGRHGKASQVRKCLCDVTRKIMNASVGK
nr:fructose-bisphosphate aldolase-like [Halyomorpha halys]XP_014275183.1 fructose-bisphosphate aldolase-like [Halyomorpha halys]XP_014275184.1 fructose-bisphosphate aldolase-like [Halyomorpha halys]XP_014275185.1 fructose-bisphosphate aldolase-like [Halyomorpha halys]